MRLYLASTSPARLATLRAAGIEPVLIDPALDEDAVLAAAGDISPVDAVQVLARAKAEAVRGRLVDSEAIDGIVIGGDSLFELEGRVYGKPHRPELAIERWKTMRGRTGTLHSGLWAIDHRVTVSGGGGTGAALGGIASAHVSFAPDITDEEIEAYVATGEPLQVAGAFTIDGRGSAFIVKVDGDPHAVVGISVSLLRDCVTRLGVDWPQLWNR
ncbi:MAG: Maf family nucleotide pyrophosphatase [Salinibacterium sp.]|nr:Maf family nucleotide pyrophosphatase [Salinibacterium sp.]